MTVLYVHFDFLIAEFYQMNKSTVIIKAGERMWNETLNSDMKIIIAQGKIKII